MSQSKSVDISGIALRSIITSCAIVFVWNLASLAELLLQVQTGAISIIDGFPRIVAPFCLLLGVTLGFKWSIFGRVFLVISAGLSLIAASSGPALPAKFWAVFALSILALAFLEYRQARKRAEA